MSEVKFEWNDNLDKDLFDQISTNMSKILSEVVCPTHGERPTVLIKGAGLQDLTFEVRGCCDDLVQRSLKQLQ